MDDRMLADIGLTRSDLRDAYAEPLWRDPTDVLAGRARDKRRYRGAGMRRNAPSIAPEAVCRAHERRPHSEASGRLCPAGRRSAISCVPSHDADQAPAGPPRRALSLSGSQNAWTERLLGDSAPVLHHADRHAEALGSWITIVPSTSLSQFICVGAMKKSASSQPGDMRSRLSA